MDTLSVWHERLPEFDYEAIGAKYKAMKNETMTEAESNVWKRIQSLIQRFLNADRIVLGTPMWNFGLPYKLKQLIDLVSQRNYLFTYDGKQYGPFLKVEKAIVVYTRERQNEETAPVCPYCPQKGRPNAACPLQCLFAHHRSDCDAGQIGTGEAMTKMSGILVVVSESAWNCFARVRGLDRRR